MASDKTTKEILEEQITQAGKMRATTFERHQASNAHSGENQLNFVRAWAEIRTEETSLIYAYEQTFGEIKGEQSEE